MPIFVPIPIETVLSADWCNLKSYSRSIYITMSTKYYDRDDNDCIEWSHDELVFISKLPSTTVKRAVKQLKNKNFIFVYISGGRWHKQTYYILNPNYIEVNQSQIIDWNPSKKGRIYDKHWQVIRQQALERDKFMCTKCGAREKLHIHHLRYPDNRKVCIDDVITLCASCHRKVKTK